MSLLATTLRKVPRAAPAGPSAICSQKRYASNDPNAPRVATTASWQKKKERKRVKHLPTGRVDKKWPGVFRPMNAGQLTHPLFHPESRNPLSLSAFQPDKLRVAKAMRFPMKENSPVRIFGLPKDILLEFRMISAPFSVVRDVTKTVVERLSAANKQSSLHTRVVLTGEPGCGKSYTLLQALEHCFANGWIVLYFPRAINMVNSTSPYVYDLRTQTYVQPAFAFQTLQRFLTVNSAALEELKTQLEVTLDRRPAPVPAGTSLASLISIGTKDPSMAPSVLTAVLDELGKQKDYPVLLAVDDFQALYCKTLYRDANFGTIKPYHLSMPRLILEYASGRRSFARGAVMGAISTEHTLFQLPVELREALGLPHDKPTGPYVKRSPEIVEYTRGLKALPVPDRLSVEEAASIFEVWKDDAWVNAAARDEYFMAKYSEASGNARDLVRVGLRTSIET
ncbi:hypothetical protein PUNSTDRAFT_51852 [Punctularia strigosozonata HHB-11173 SS5]|uniref:uncharacterized protein n=1 Tax=Punctularia strigosozonata (strain HHB-11173) TaxID=741275 RepID=UPI000441748A|nr:uncharacterized protein PUNSTDRAFT_51852 [Punctularia strigosozonata HHB-11173 SS5]EIN09639.1 hypothetical protein PUNSTDRAFT_51852 [Punctularia strigosozonata HHB-11173 SS5]